jgi:hypothetical protein
MSGFLHITGAGISCISFQNLVHRSTSINAVEHSPNFPISVNHCLRYSLHPLVMPLPTPLYCCCRGAILGKRFFSFTEVSLPHLHHENWGMVCHHGGSSPHSPFLTPSFTNGNLQCGNNPPDLPHLFADHTLYLDFDVGFISTASSCRHLVDQHYNCTSLAH